MTTNDDDDDVDMNDDTVEGGVKAGGHYSTCLTTRVPTTSEATTIHPQGR